MDAKKDLEKQVFMAARDQGISSVLFRNASSRKLGLNATDADCLSFLTINGGTSTPTALGRYTGLTTGSTTAMLDRLEKAGFVTRKPNPNDRRGIVIEITAKYGELARPLVADMQIAHQALLASYSAQELETIADFLTRFTNNVQDQTKKIDQDLA